MKKVFVKTQNYARFASGVEAVEKRGAKEAGMMLVHGTPGNGKSTIVYRWAQEAGALFLRANVDWTPRYFMQELARTLKVDTRGTGQQLFARLLGCVVDSQSPIIIDEAEFTLRNNAATLEKIRDLSDRAMVTVVLIGMGAIESTISRHPQISSRIAHVVEFTPADLSDVTLACEKLCEEKLTPALVAEVHRLSGGRIREVLNIVAEIERLAKVNGLSGQMLDTAHFAGVQLAHDWQIRGGRGKRAA